MRVARLLSMDDKLGVSVLVGNTVSMAAPSFDASPSQRTAPLYLLLTCACLPVFAIAAVTGWHAEITPDDSYYYFAIARELVTTGSFSFDGQALATGFHPLWLAFCTLIYLIAGDALPYAINGIALLGFLGYAAFWYLGLTRLDMTEGARRVLFAFGVVNAPLSFAAFSGMETSLVLAGAAAVFYTLVRALEPADFNPFWLSAAVVLVFLARLDSILFVAPVLLWLFLRDMRRFFFPMATIGTVVIAYMATSYLLFGSAVPSSTSSLRLLWYPGWLAQETPWASTGYFLDFPSHLIVTLRSAYWDLKMAAGVSGFVFDLSWPAHIAVLLLAGVSIAAVRWRPVDTDGPASDRAARLWAAAMLCCGIGIFIYACVVRLGGPREWYLQGPGFLTLAAGALLVSAFPARWQPGRLMLGVQIAVFAVTVPGFVANSWVPLYRAEVAREAMPLVRPGVLGAFNAGVYGWGAPGVVNLDGVVNNAVYEAIRDKRLSRYLRETGITHILDVDDDRKILGIITRSSTISPPGLTTIRTWPDENGFEHRLYRLDWPQ